MTWLVESPWPVLAAGVAIEIVLVLLLFRTGRAIFIAPIVLVAALVGGLVMVERVVVTEKEEVEDALAGVASALTANDTPAVLAAFTPNCPRLGEVRSALSQFEVSRASIGGDLEIRLNRLTIPPSATTYFTGHIEGRDRRGVFPYDNMFRRFKVTLHREQGRWLIADYSDAEPGQRRAR
jgi:hypothetical protein